MSVRAPCAPALPADAACVVYAGADMSVGSRFHCRTATLPGRPVVTNGTRGTPAGQRASLDHIEFVAIVPTKVSIVF